MDDRTNTIAGWVLASLIVALGSSIIVSELFHNERPEKMGFPIEGVEAESEGGGAPAEQPIAFYLASADPAKGAEVFKKCAACHKDGKGAPNALGPNLWGVVGSPHAHVAGFAYSDALKGKPGAWDWDALNHWLTSPKAYAPGTKMTFAGLSNPQDRANVIAYLNAQSDSPQPLPKAPPPEAAGAEKGEATANAAGAAETANASASAEAANAAAPAEKK